MRTEIKKHNKIIIKIGSSLISSVNKDHIEGICEDISNLKDDGKQIIIVTSGAISQGMGIVGITEKPTDTKKLQALAAIGQQKLMHSYQETFNQHNKQTAQILITHNDINDRVRYLNIKGTLEELLANDVIPIINENDVVSTEEIKLGDNDNLASMIANIVNADLMIILTDQNGMYDKNPDIHDNAVLIDNINTRNLKNYDSDFNTETVIGTGGFKTKIQAVKRAALSNTFCVIANGMEKSVLQRIINEDNIGTFFVPDIKRVNAKKQWLDTIDNSGSVIIDDGACTALKINNKSLLAIGIKSTENKFQRGDVIKCMNTKGTCIAKGITNYSSEEIDRIKGKTSKEIVDEYGNSYTKEIINRDDLIIIEI